MLNSALYWQKRRTTEPQTGLKQMEAQWVARLVSFAEFGNKQKKESPASFPVIATAVLPSIISSSSGCSSSQHGNSVCSLAASLSHRSGPPPWRENEERN
ncbi:hypothetical protein CHARACLAT_009695 [Characodon lateralis]|uniref:Uncharacterized protein n=1 Tax=Characodon lateralis TaxID=208331 RepID=A0ABU7EHR7_9TELE|nr:hypothetical protein [Characodon lateralis]